MKHNRALLLFFLPLVIACSSKEGGNNDDALKSFDQSRFESYIKVLASDEFQGRMPFTEGEEKTVAYLEKEFKALGLEPGNGDSYFQNVPMVEITPTADSIMQVKSSKGKTLRLRGFDDFIISSRHTEAEIDWKNVPLVFAGFGIVAPEYNWNDYENLDVKNKIVVVLVNDPGFGSGDSTFFKGNTMTYYGRWTYKFEEAARQGAKGCLVIHDTAPAGYPFQVLQSNWNSAHLYLDTRGHETYQPDGVGWITKAAIGKVFALAGLDFSKAEAAAHQRGYKAQALDAGVSLRMKLKVRYDNSRNVVAKLTGSKRPDEYIIYTAHWDHLGIGPKDASGDSIYNGAIDNASGTAGLLELAAVFKSLDPKPERSILFLAVTGEEQGLLGSEYYAAHPIYPKEKTVAEINMDVVNPYGKMKDVMVIGSGQSELEDYLAKTASSMGRYLRPDSEPEKGFYFRSDHFNFAKVGIPALYIESGTDFVGKGTAYGQKLKDEYTEKYYHQPSDEYDTTRLNFEGGIDDLKLLFEVGKKLAFEDTWPKWKEGSEFKAVRERN
ncbi:MAG TPA: M28 family metallopeptidase [Chryseosolibacter sp.]|nr:M28 family metallopeptidase [Chryseosolibacter sp.]